MDVLTARFLRFGHSKKNVSPVGESFLYAGQKNSGLSWLTCKANEVRLREASRKLRDKRSVPPEKRLGGRLS